jgi:hypothetical protein
MEPEVSLSCYEKTATRPYPEPDESNSHPQSNVYVSDINKYFKKILRGTCVQSMFKSLTLSMKTFLKKSYIGARI